jgi:exonuclease SbcC
MAMIPRRVYVEGFMSYRDGATLLFDDSSLWALSGENGAGKSAIFDAITFALYSKHRAGKQNAVALINQQANNLRVEFDFALGDDVYRAKRTLNDKGRTSCQIFHVSGPNPPEPGKSSPQSVPDTETARGFDSWIKDHLGIDDKTFTASVLLQQGKSEAMLEADPKDRHTMLTQIVDLSAYKLLHEQVDDKRKTLEKEAQIYEKQLKGLKVIDKAEIERLTEEITEADEQVQKTQRKLEDIARYQVQAQQWAELKREQQEIQELLTEAQDLFLKTDKIRQDADRLSELSGVLPTLEYLFQEGERLAKSVQEIVRYQDEEKDWGKKLRKAQNELDKANEHLQHLREQQANWQKQLNEGQRALIKFAPQIEELNSLAAARTELRTFEQDLKVFPTNLDEQINRLQEEVDLLTELEVAFPWLKEFAQVRSNWRQARLDEAEAEAQILALNEALSVEAKEQSRVLAETEKVKRSVDELDQQITKQETLLAGVEEQLERFKLVEGQLTCHYCGQKLTREHLEAERKRLEGEYQETDQRVQNTKNLYATAFAKHQLLLEEIENQNQKLETLKHEKSEAERKQQLARRDQQSAKGRVVTILEAIPARYRSQILSSHDVDFITCLEAEYPTEADLDALSEQRSHYAAKKLDLEQIRQQANKRDKLITQSQQCINRIRQFEEKYPETVAQEIRAAYDQADGTKQQAENELAQLIEPVDKAQQAVEVTQKIVDKADTNHRQALTNVQAEGVRQEELRRTISSREAELTAAWRDAASSLTKEQLDIWRSEKEILSGADERLNKLAEAEREQNSREKRLSQLQRQISQIPPEAQRPVAELEAEEETARQEQAGFEEERRHAEREKIDLENQYQRRCELEKKQRQANQQAKLHKELAKFLGPDYLQRYLLQQAEVGIVANANEVLDRISGGVLRLELKQSSNDSPQSTKALDIMAYNSEVGQAPMPVAFLSGSQRFRVAISLALGIGQYMSQESRRIESVIIDEGFGSLDKNGRQEVIDELHRLQDILQRIILVSHQEEFTEAFPNRYEITLKNGTSIANRV